MLKSKLGFISDICEPYTHAFQPLSSRTNQTKSNKAHKALEAYKDIRIQTVSERALGAFVFVNC